MNCITDLFSPKVWLHHLIGILYFYFFIFCIKKYSYQLNAVKTMGGRECGWFTGKSLETDWPGFKFRLHHFLSGWLHTNCSLALSFFTCSGDSNIQFTGSLWGLSESLAAGKAWENVSLLSLYSLWAPFPFILLPCRYCWISRDLISREGVFVWLESMKQTWLI